MKNWSGRQDSNLRPSVPKTDALPGCATPRNVNEDIVHLKYKIKEKLILFFTTFFI